MLKLKSAFKNYLLGLHSKAIDEFASLHKLYAKYDHNTLYNMNKTDEVFRELYKIPGMKKYHDALQKNIDGYSRGAPARDVMFHKYYFDDFMTFFIKEESPENVHSKAQFDVEHWYHT